MPGARRLRVAMAGVGGFGAARRARMRGTGLFELVAAYDTNPEALGAAEREDGARPVERYADMLDIPGLEAVFLATGADSHAELAVAAAEKGLHVYIEKPLCTSHQEVEELIGIQRRTGVVMAVGHHDLFGDAVARSIRGFLDSGECGRTVAIEATTCHSGGFHVRPGDWRGSRAANPGGMLFQCGVHKLHEMMHYCGPVASVHCIMRYDANPDTDTADAAICSLAFESGVIGTLNAYHVTPYRHCLNLYGTAMNLYKEENGPAGVTLTAQRLAPLLDGGLESRVRVDVPEGPGDTEGLQSFHRCATMGGTPYPSLLDGARAVEVVFACAESALTGRSVPVNPV